MKSVNIDRNKLLRTIQENRQIHVEAYKKTLEAWREEVTVILEATHKKMRQGDGFIPNNRLFDSAPASHVDDYDRVIRMLEMSTDEVISISVGEFDQYVLDQWNWRQSFDLMSSKYAGGDEF